MSRSVSPSNRVPSVGGLWANWSRFTGVRFHVRYQRCSLVASLFSSWRYLAATSSYFLHATINLRPASVTASASISASIAVAFQSPDMSNTRTSLCTQPVLSFSFPPRPLHTAPSRFPITNYFGNRPTLIRTSAPAHKRTLVPNAVSMLSHRVISRAWLYEVVII